MKLEWQIHIQDQASQNFIMNRGDHRRTPPIAEELWAIGVHKGEILFFVFRDMANDKLPIFQYMV